MDVEILKQQYKLESYKTNHLLHLFLTVFTLGFWLLIWVPVGLYNNHMRHYAKKKLFRIATKEETPTVSTPPPQEKRVVKWKGGKFGCQFSA